MTKDDVKLVSLDGVLTWKFRCPGCAVWGHLDDDQFYGRVSILCPECGWHETHNLADMTDGTE